MTIVYQHHSTRRASTTCLWGAYERPSATVAGLSQYLWKLEQPAHAVANGYFMGCLNRVGTEAPWNIGKFYGTSYFVDPRGRIVAEAAALMGTVWALHFVSSALKVGTAGLSTIVTAGGRLFSIHTNLR